MTTISLFEYNIHSNLYGFSFDDKKLLVSTINPHSYCIAKKDELYRQSLKASDILLPDGVGIVWALRFLTGLKIKRIAGADLHLNLLEKLNATGGRAFYMGSSTLSLQKIKARVKNEYPNMEVAVYSPPFKPDFSEKENREILSAINSFRPDVLFVGMTAPKQEKWAFKNKDFIDAKIIASIGAVFDFYAGTVKRPGIFWQKAGLEWLPRLLREPKRLWRRNFISTPLFLWDVIKAKTGR